MKDKVSGYPLPFKTKTNSEALRGEETVTELAYLFDNHMFFTSFTKDTGLTFIINNITFMKMSDLYSVFDKRDKR
jgi:hypothetical protein